VFGLGYTSPDQQLYRHCHVLYTGRRARHSAWDGGEYLSDDALAPFYHLFRECRPNFLLTDETRFGSAQLHALLKHLDRVRQKAVSASDAAGLREAFAYRAEVTDLDFEVKKAALVLLAEEISLLVRLAHTLLL